MQNNTDTDRRRFEPELRGTRYGAKVHVAYTGSSQTNCGHPAPSQIFDPRKVKVENLCRSCVGRPEFFLVENLADRVAEYERAVADAAEAR